MTPYQPRQRPSVTDVVWLATTTLVVGAAAGFLASAVGQFYRSAIFTPMVTGVVVGLGGLLTVFWRRFNSRWLAVGIGLLGVVAAMVSDHAFDYMRDRQAIGREMQLVLESLDDQSRIRALESELPAALNRAFAGLEQSNTMDVLGALGLVSASAHSDAGALAALRGWLSLRWRAGPSMIDPSGVRVKSGQVHGQLYLVASILLAGAVAGWMLWQAANTPICPHCGDWLDHEYASVAVANAGFQDAARAAFEQQDVEKLSRMYPRRGLHAKYLQLNFRACGHCRHEDHYVELVRVATRGKKWSYRLVDKLLDKKDAVNKYARMELAKDQSRVYASRRLVRAMLPENEALSLAKEVADAGRRQRENAIREVVRSPYRK